MSQNSISIWDENFYWTQTEAEILPNLTKNVSKKQQLIPSLMKLWDWNMTVSLDKPSVITFILFYDRGPSQREFGKLRKATNELYRF